jgi:hypothetical protein
MPPPAWRSASSSRSLPQAKRFEHFAGRFPIIDLADQALA